MRIIISELRPVPRIFGLTVRLPVSPSNGKLTLYRTISCALVDTNSTKSKNIISVFQKIIFLAKMYKRGFSRPLSSLKTFLIIYKTNHAYPFEGSPTFWGHMSLPPPPPHPSPVNQNHWGIQACIPLHNAVQIIRTPNSLNHFKFLVSGTWQATPLCR
jgi:hypothetical protein